MSAAPLASVKVKVRDICTGLKRSGGFQEVEAPRFQDNRNIKVVRLSALRTGRLYPPRNILGTHFFWGAPGDVVVKHYATNRQVAGSIPDGVIGIFQ
jgi:hypothetical protein